MRMTDFLSGKTVLSLSLRTVSRTTQRYEEVQTTFISTRIPSPVLIWFSLGSNEKLSFQETPSLVYYLYSKTYVS